ncbi:HypC/HybG/HupF family hydrogenase formation chaperone [Dehalobacterium formicoaceticum]|uniref:HypC/HybG/HupF family hydrogenase formation chaperone n=1 Tax=Dehalobacterium formicoaceticum TaxID=51515 RepID=A0ABT1Y6V0_9FIRM|nr:HypC/HybG/HupF family hydrogenase formation chaperone [Dehalobacterium formicoaceticum]MCR6546597.1 HypC/HybG/HupF family hydrogenase formation chaperone [Dehalobacterium formicoaceticum]
MCLAVPARIVKIDERHAWAETKGVGQRINIQLIDAPIPGDYILVHAGFAIEKIDVEYFRFLNETLDEMLEGTGNDTGNDTGNE